MLPVSEIQHPPSEKNTPITNKSPTNQILKQLYSSRNLSTARTKTAWNSQLKLLLNRPKPEVETLLEQLGDFLTILGREDPHYSNLLSLTQIYSTQSKLLSTQHSCDSRKIMQLHFDFYVERLFKTKGVQKLDSMTFMGSFQLWILSMILWKVYKL